MRRLALLLIGSLLPGAAGAEVIDLNVLLPEMEQAARPAVPLRADGELAVTTPENTRREQIVMLQRENGDLYIELRPAQLKYLILEGGKRAVAHTPGAKEAGALADGATLDGSDFTREDLRPFAVAQYHTPRIVDQSAGEVQIALFPQKSQYSMVVITFDRQKRVPIKHMYYQETLSNLVKMRRDQGHVLVGRRWLPATISIENFAMRATSTLTLQWAQAPNVTPEMFDPLLLPRPSTIEWPAAKP
jgi:hypothetical protein